MTTTSTSVHDGVRAALERSGRPYLIHEPRRLAAAIAGPADVARALAIEPERIAKTLLLVEQTGARRYALLCCSWNARADVKALASEIGYSRLGIASPEALAGLLGYPRGGVSQLGAPRDVAIAIAIDDALCTFPSVLIGAGASGVEIELAGTDLAAITDAVVGRFAVPPS